MPNRDVEIGNAAADVPGCLGDIYEEFEKEDLAYETYFNDFAIKKCQRSCN